MLEMLQAIYDDSKTQLELAKLGYITKARQLLVENNISNFEELCKKVNYLQKARNALKTLESQVEYNLDQLNKEFAKQGQKNALNEKCGGVDDGNF